MDSAPGPTPAAGTRDRRAWLLGVPLALAAGAYARVLNAPFVFDDQASILDNPTARDVGASIGALGRGLVGGGRSVTDLTFALNHAAGGLAPWGYHVANVAVHLTVVALVFLFTRSVVRLAGSGPRPESMALVVAGLFALHPLQSESVSYLSQRSESLASAFYLATLLLLLAAERRARSAGGVAAYLAALVAFLLGMATKPILVTLPVAYVLLRWMVPPAGNGAARSVGGRRLLAGIAALGTLGALGAVATLLASRGSHHTGFSVPGLGPAEYFRTQSRVVATYLRLLVWPTGQSVDWGFPPSRGLDAATLAAGLFLVAVLGGAGWLFARCRRRDDAAGAAGRLAAFGVAWFFLVLAPTSSVVPLADTLAEHRIYLASWGVLLALVVGGARLAERVPAAWRARVLAATVGALWLGLALCLHARNAVWESPLALWSDAVEKAPDYWRPYLQLGKAYREQGRFPEALRAYRAAAAQPVDLPQREATILAELGAMLVQVGEIDEASATLRRAIALQPEQTIALANLAVIALRRQDLVEAERYASAALAQKADLPRALEILGAVRFHRGETAAALPLLAQAARIDPGSVAALLYLGFAHERLGQRPDACAAWSRLLRIPALPPPARQQVEQRFAADGCAGR
jgi:tetratricopeptide (TPR) repeat protein